MTDLCIEQPHLLFKCICGVNRVHVFSPAVHPCQGGVAEGEQLGVDDGEHGLAAAVAVAQGELQQVQQTLWEYDGRHEVQLCKENSTGTHNSFLLCCSHFLYVPKHH